MVVLGITSTFPFRSEVHKVQGQLLLTSATSLVIPRASLESAVGYLNIRGKA